MLWCFLGVMDLLFLRSAVRWLGGKTSSFLAQCKSIAGSYSSFSLYVSVKEMPTLVNKGPQPVAFFGSPTPLGHGLTQQGFLAPSAPCVLAAAPLLDHSNADQHPIPQFLVCLSRFLNGNASRNSYTSRASYIHPV